MKFTPAAALLVAANLVPLAGALWFGWRSEQILILYWMESFVVGAWNLARYAVAQPANWGTGLQRVCWRLAHAAFFVLHFGALNIAFGVLIGTLVLRDNGAGFYGVEVIVQRFLAGGGGMIALACLAASHGWSYFANYLLGGEYRRVTSRDLRNRPYRRMVITYILIFAVGLPLHQVGEMFVLTVVFVVLKTAFDLYFHLADHSAKMSP